MRISLLRFLVFNYFEWTIKSVASLLSWVEKSFIVCCFDADMCCAMNFVCFLLLRSSCILLRVSFDCLVRCCCFNCLCTLRVLSVLFSISSSFLVSNARSRLCSHRHAEKTSSVQMWWDFCLSFCLSSSPSSSLFCFVCRCNDKVNFILNWLKEKLTQKMFYKIRQEFLGDRIKRLHLLSSSWVCRLLSLMRPKQFVDHVTNSKAIAFHAGQWTQAWCRQINDLIAASKMHCAMHV